MIVSNEKNEEKMIELVKHIEKINSETQAWVDEDPKNRWGGMLVTDPEHWAESGIYTPEDFDKSSLAETIAQASKDATGSKYRIDWMEYTLEELQKMADRYCEAANEEYEREKAHKAEMAEKFEARVKELINMGAGDRETALRWIIQSEDLDHWTCLQDGYAAYCLNLPDSYTKELDLIIHSLVKSEEAA